MNIIPITKSIQPTVVVQSIPHEAVAEKFVEARRVLSCLAHGVMIVDQEGHVVELYLADRTSPFAPWSSKIAVGGSGPIAERHDASAVLFEGDARGRTAFELNFMQLVDDMLPSEVVTAQLPPLCEREGTRFRLRYHADRRDDTFRQLVVLIQELAAGVSEEQLAEENAEFRKVTETLLRNVDAARGFFVDTQWLLSEIHKGEADVVTLKRNLHTLKGNLAVFGFESMANVVHAAEDALADGEPGDYQSLLGAIDVAWASKRRTFGDLLDSRADKEVVVTREEYEEVVMYLMAQMDPAETLGLVQRWALDPVSRVFARLEMQASHMAARMGKKVEVSIEHNTVRLPGQGLQALWASLVHAVRNSLDHGLETAAGRKAAGKAETGTLGFRAEMTDDEVHIDIIDDGRGIDWGKVEAKAQAAGLPCATHDERVAALLSDGLSTVDSVSLTSGRGVGTSAVAAAASDLGGRVEIDSPPPGAEHGTRVRVVLPLAQLATMGLLS